MTPPSRNSWLDALTNIYAHRHGSFLQGLDRCEGTLPSLVEDTAGAVPGGGVLSVHLGRFLRLNELDELKPRCKFGLEDGFLTNSIR